MSMTASRVGDSKKTRRPKEGKPSFVPSSEMPVEGKIGSPVQTSTKRGAASKRETQPSDIIVLEPVRSKKEWTEDDSEVDTEPLEEGSGEEYSDSRITEEQDFEEPTGDEEEDGQEEGVRPKQPRSRQGYADVRYSTKSPLPPRATAHQRITEPVQAQPLLRQNSTSTTTTAIGFTRPRQSVLGVLFAILLIGLEGLAQVVVAIWKINWITKILLIVVVLSLAWCCGNAINTGVHYSDDRYNDLVYRNPRTSQVDVTIGINDDVTHPSHLLVSNLHGRIYLVVSEGKSLQNSVSYVSRPLSIENADRLPINISFAPGDRPGLKNIVLTIGDPLYGEEHIILINNGKTLIQQ